MRIGLVSDTHGLLRPALFEALERVDHILHAGDLGPADLMAELEAIAPVTGVFGNTDGFDVRDRWRESAEVEVGGIRAGVMHGHLMGSPTPERVAAAFPDCDLAVFGHTHQAVIRTVGRTTVVNPGAAGPRRFDVRPTCAIATVAGRSVSVDLVSLEG
jgi:uncharacterized protein